MKIINISYLLIKLKSKFINKLLKIYKKKIRKTTLFIELLCNNIIKKYINIKCDSGFNFINKRKLLQNQNDSINLI